MRVVDAITSRAGRLAGDVQDSLRRARSEGERRMLQRQHRTALEELGLRTYELVKAGELPDEPIGVEIAAVEAKLIEIEAKIVEIEQLRDDESDADQDADDDRRGADETREDAALTAFPMIADAPDERPGEGGEGPDPAR